MFSDNEVEHPCVVCSPCRVAVGKCCSDKVNLPEHFTVIDFPSLNRSLVCAADCWVCLEKDRPEFIQTYGRASKPGRPVDKSPLGFMCNKCGSNVTTMLSHVCDDKIKAVQNFKHRLERNNLDEPVACKIVKDKVSLSNIRGKPTVLPTKSEKPVLTTDELLDLSMNSGGKGGLCRDDRKLFLSYMKKKGVQVPSEDTVLKIKEERCGDLFVESTGKTFFICHHVLGIQNIKETSAYFSVPNSKEEEESPKFYETH